MNPRPQLGPTGIYVNTSLAIRQEIQRFESVHPSIYAIYDLIDLIPDGAVAQQIRDHVVCIEDSFVNSQEWTLARTVPELRLGIVGALNSGKSALVHRYLTGSYMQEESPEGGRFKKEILVDNQSYLLLIRDEGGAPELQFTSWVDAVIFVFSLENELSFSAIYGHYTKMMHHRNSTNLDIPLILVGTQDAISENNPRVIDDARARKLAADLNRCSYYETCATYGLNVEKVFQEACQKVVQTTFRLRPAYMLRHHHHNHHQWPINGHENNNKQQHTLSLDNLSVPPPPSTSTATTTTTAIKEATPNSTPTATRKTRRRSNLFTPAKGMGGADHNKKNNGTASGGTAGMDFGSGRAIPLKQGYLYKKSSKPLNKEWKKKYVTLCDNGRMTYHPSLHDYMDDVHGKEIPLQYVTVKVPGQKPRGSKSILTTVPPPVVSVIVEKDPSGGDDDAAAVGGVTAATGGMTLSSSASFLNGAADTPNVKKRHRRVKSSGLKSSDCDDGDNLEFYIVSLEGKQWHFDTSSVEERDDWVGTIEQQILTSLQLNETSKTTKSSSAAEEFAVIQSIKSRVPGNGQCVDCATSNPDWASLNLGVLMCIECSGIHRNLGSHLSRVRSLDLDEWPPSHQAVMLAIGNTMANSIWESHVPKGRIKPQPNAMREEKEQWIRAKYDMKQFLAPPSPSPPTTTVPAMTLGQQLIDAVCQTNVKLICQLLTRATVQQVNTTVGARDLRTPLHLTCAMGQLAIAQLLIWHHADVKAVDQDGRTCLTYARAAASIAQAKYTATSNTSLEVAAQSAKHLVDLLVAYGCPEMSSVAISGTIPRRRGGGGSAQAPSSII